MNEPCPSNLHLSRYHDGEMEETGISAHVARCSACAQHLQSLHTLDAVVTDALPTLIARARKPPTIRSRGWAAAAAAALLCCLGGLALNRPPSEGAERRYQVSAGHGQAYHVAIEGDAQLLSIEVNGTVAHFYQEERQ